MTNFLEKNNYKFCYVYIKSGAGGIDSKDWIVILSKMYIGWANINHFKYKILSEYSLESLKNKYLILEIYGKYSYRLFKTESGIHRLIRKSPFDSWKRHTSFGSVNVYSKNENFNKIIELKKKDLKIDFFKSSGPGGQHVNKTESAVRITHLPTGIVSVCQNNRFQSKNKFEAISKLKYKLNNLEERFIKKRKQENYLSKLEISWSNHIRSYFLDNSIIKDIRTNIVTKNIKSILNGNLKIFIEKSLELNI